MDTTMGIPIKDYPELRLVSQHLADDAVVTPAEALSLYERGHRSISIKDMKQEELKFLEKLVEEEGNGVFL